MRVAVHNKVFLVQEKMIKNIARVARIMPSRPLLLIDNTK